MRVQILFDYSRRRCVISQESCERGPMALQAEGNFDLVNNLLSQMRRHM